MSLLARDGAFHPTGLIRTMGKPVCGHQAVRLHLDHNCFLVADDAHAAWVVPVLQAVLAQSGLQFSKGNFDGVRFHGPTLA